MAVKGRFAPTPSGRMHLGNLFSALLAWLSVRSQNGRIVLRIEDLDIGRCRMENALQFERDLRWLGLDWDEGGCFEPYLQSKRSEVYDETFDKLDKMGLIYPCYCSRASLHAASAPHASDGRYVYSGACRDLTAEQRSQMTKIPAWRLSVPDREVSFVDGHMGAFSQNLASDCGDFIIRRADGVYGYQLAVVVDDALMGVNEVVRGCDLLDSTPRQIYVNQLLGHDIPAYYHLPLLTAPDGRRLSKRDKDMDLSELEKRYTPQQLVGKLAHIAGIIETPEAVSARELASEFSWDKVRKDANIAVISSR